MCNNSATKEVKMDELQINEKTTNLIDNAIRAACKEYDITTLNALKLYITSYKFFVSVCDKLKGDMSALEFIKKNCDDDIELVVKMLSSCYDLTKRTEEIYLYGEKKAGEDAGISNR